MMNGQSESIGMVRSTRIVDETESIEDRYYITSLTDVQLFSEAARKHSAHGFSPSPTISGIGIRNFSV